MVSRWTYFEISTQYFVTFIIFINPFFAVWHGEGAHFEKLSFYVDDINNK